MTLTKKLCALLAVLLLTGCRYDVPQEQDTGPLADLSASSQTDAPAEDPDSLPEKLSLPWNDRQTLDPVTCSDGAQQTLGALLYEGLYELDESMEPAARLCASSSSYDPASLTWKFTVRSDAVFSDGSALTAGDAAATLRRALTSARYGARLACVQSVTAADGAVKVVLNRPNTALPSLLDIPIVKAGTEGDPVPLGTGPYVLERDNSRLAANPAWWAGNNQPVGQIDLSVCRDADAVQYRFSSREIQLVTADLTGSGSVSATGSVSFHDADTSVLQYIGFNLKSGPFADSPALRAALGLGLDRETLVSTCLAGHGKAAQFPVSPVSPVYPSPLETPYSYADFQTAMTNAGYDTGVAKSVTLLVNQENGFRLAAAQAAASALSAFDLKVEVKALPWDEFVDALHKGRYDLYYGEARLTADWDLRPLVGTGGALNYGGNADTALDALLESYAASSGRPAAMQAVCRRLAVTAPILPVCFKCTSVLSQPEVIGNLTPTAANPFYDLPTCVINLAK